MDLLPVSGSVFYDGQPLRTGAVSFHPTAGTSHVPTGPIDSQGRYTLRTNYQEGAPAGRYKVVVHATEPLETGDNARKSSPGLPKSLIPAHYNQNTTTPLEVEVRQDPPSDAYDLRLER